MSGFDNLNDSLPLSEGQSGKWLNGTVTQNVDPLNKDRIQASIPGLFDPNQGDIPWLMPLKVSPFGIGSAWGVYGTPAIGSDVLVWLQEGRAEFGMYMSTVVTANSEFPSGESWGFTDPAGNRLLVEGTHVQFNAASGVTIDIDSSGKMTVTTASDCDLNVGGSVNANVSGNATITAPEAHVEGKLYVSGDTYLNGKTYLKNTWLTGTLMNGSTNLSNHYHGGVQTGSGNTGGPN